MNNNINLINLLERYEDYPMYAPDGRVYTEYIPTYLGTMVKFDDVLKIFGKTQCDLCDRKNRNCNCIISCSEFLPIGD
jgi:hypothetical protein